MTTVEAPPIAWPLPTKWQPRPYQLDALALLLRRNQVLDIGMSGGKTSIALAALEALGAMRVLVLCPDKVKAVWVDEFDDNAARTWIVWAGKVRSNGHGGGYLKNPSVARRCDAIRQGIEDARRIRRPFLAIVNYEATSQAVMRDLLLKTHWDVLICDESHHLASATGKASRLAAKIGRDIRARRGRVILTTGTFMPHSPLSIFGQMRVVNRDVLGEHVTPFRARYAKYMVLREQSTCPQCYGVFDCAVATPCPRLCGVLLQPGEPLYLAQVAKQDGSRVAVDYKIPGKRDDRIPDGCDPERYDELMERISPWVFRVSQEDLDAQTGLVEATPQLRTCSLTAAERKVYDALERDMIAQVADGTIVAANAMVNFGVLARVAAGHAKNADTGETINLNGQGELCSLARLLLDELSEEDPREPIVVYANWRFDFDQIELVARKLGRRYGELSGRRSDGVDGKWMHPDIDLLAVQWKSGAEGVNFSRARHEIDYTMTAELAKFDQAPRRLNRQGQSRLVTRRVLVAEDTLLVNWFYALKKRRSVNNAVLDRLKGLTTP
ncbi:MAG TPA: DEAD/DEAH box helicase [Solirubrobacteraceae bacterium]|nr:DEAD/DEAH box helicase [Solirubrobacteraceae bacterium]